MESGPCFWGVLPSLWPFNGALCLGIARRFAFAAAENHAETLSFFRRMKRRPSPAGRVLSPLEPAGCGRRYWRADTAMRPANIVMEKIAERKPGFRPCSAVRKKEEREAYAGKSTAGQGVFGAGRPFAKGRPRRPIRLGGVPGRLYPPACPRPGTDLRRR